MLLLLNASHPLHARILIIFSLDTARVVSEFVTSNGANIK
jgi:hypothetical protein